MVNPSLILKKQLKISNEYNEPYSLTRMVYYFSQRDLPGAKT